MPTIRFIRTTHENGQFRSFHPEAHHFWREQGVIVGEVLRPECALTLAELAAAGQEYTPQQISPATVCHQAKPAWPGVGHMARMGVVVIAAAVTSDAGVCGRGRHHRELEDLRQKGDAGSGQRGGVVQWYYGDGAEAGKGGG